MDWFNWSCGGGTQTWPIDPRGGDVDTQLVEISAKGDGLERVASLVDFELFRSTLEAAAPRRDHSRGGRPPFDHVLIPKVPRPDSRGISSRHFL